MASATSLLLPLACWMDVPCASGARVTATAVSEDGRNVVAGFTNGHIWIYDFSGGPGAALNSKNATKLSPKVYLVGHRAAVAVIKLARVEIDSPALTDNVVISASSDGEVVMWDIADGRCLQLNSTAFVGHPTSLHITSSGRYILLSGHSNKICALDVGTLETAYETTVYDWISSLSLHPSESKGMDRILALTLDGKLWITYFDEENFMLPMVESYHLRSSKTPGFLVEINRFDRRMAMAVYRLGCTVNLADPNVTVLGTIPSPATQSWSGAQFLSARTILLWTQTGSSYIYFLGRPKDILLSNVLDVPAGHVVLFSDGVRAYHVERMHLLVFHNIESSKAGEMTIWSYWASVFGTQLGPSVGCYSSLVAAQHIGIQIHLLVIDFNFTDIWGVTKKHRIDMTAATLVMEKYLAIGLSNGDIRIVLLSAPFFFGPEELESRTVLHLRGHVGAVTALYSPLEHFLLDEEKILLLSGSTDCSTKIWNLVTGELLASLVSHTESVTGFMPVPSDISFGHKVRHRVMSLAKDHSIALVDIEDLQVIYRFSGHSSAIVGIHWRKMDENFIVSCADSSIFVWQMRTGHLDRVVSGQLAQDILADADVNLTVREYGLEYHAVNIKRTMTAFPVHSAVTAPPPLLISLVNVKRLISDIYSGQQILSPTASPRNSTNELQPRNTPFMRGYSNVSEEDEHSPDTPRTATRGRRSVSDLPGEQRRSSAASESSPTRTVVAGLQPFKAKSKENSETGGGKSDVKDGVPDSTVVQSIYSALMSWGVDEEVDRVCEERLGLAKPGAHVAYCIRGAGGYLSILAPAADLSRRTWTISPTLTASRLLKILSLSRAVLSMTGLEEEASTIITHYGAMLPNHIGPAMKMPSFSYLAKYWQDPMVDIQQASRSMFSSALLKMPLQDKNTVLEYWKPHLPTIARNLGTPIVKTHMRTAVILGIISSEQPTLFESRLLRDLAQSLELVIREDTRNTYRLAAMELIGRAFSTLEPHMNGQQIIRMMVGMTGLWGQPPAPTQGSTSGQSTPTLQSTANSIPGALAGIANVSQSVMLMARNVVVQIAIANPSLFVTTECFDLMHAKTPGERLGSLKLLGMFIAKRPLLAYPHVPKLMDAMVKSLDPNQASMREALQQTVTINFAEIVRTFPNISFHGPSQRMAVGTPEGFGIIYDLRTAMRVQVLEGHSRPITALSFSPDGKLLASFSLEENCVHFYQPTVGFLGSLVGALNQVRASSTSGPGSQSTSGAATQGPFGSQMKSFRTFNVGPPEVAISLSSILEKVSFEWISDRGVRLQSVKGVELVFNV
ncbi:hypothetical protein BJ742DRAFT_684998 [Cladochytrium replicatum]|nr:hypothetical protein BJ742DRAFT_684998 [Cladochytrium replicatum]